MSEVAIYTQAQPLTVKEHNGQRVVTFKDIDTLHQRPEGTAKRNFNENKERFIEGEDYFNLTQSQKYEIRTLEIPNRGLTVFTQFGYLMLVKSFTDDLAWQIQRQLVKTYFNHKQAEAQTVQLQPELSEKVDRLLELLEQPQTQWQIKTKSIKNKYLTREELTAYLNMSIASIDRLLARKDFTPKTKEGKNILIDREALDIWLKEHKGCLTSAKKVYDMDELKKKKLLTKEEAAFYMGGICTKTLNRLISKTNFTPLVRIGFGYGRTFINREKLDEWINEQDGSWKTVK